MAEVKHKSVVKPSHAGKLGALGKTITDAMIHNCTQEVAYAVTRLKRETGMSTKDAVHVCSKLLYKAISNNER